MTLYFTVPDARIKMLDKLWVIQLSGLPLQYLQEENKWQESFSPWMVTKLLHTPRMRIQK
jgi:hypothetical protein